MDKKGTHCVKILTEKLTSFGKLTSRRVDEWISERGNRSALRIVT